MASLRRVEDIVCLAGLEKPSTRADGEGSVHLGQSSSLAAEERSRLRLPASRLIGVLRLNALEGLGIAADGITLRAEGALLDAGKD